MRLLLAILVDDTGQLHLRFAEGEAVPVRRVAVITRDLNNARSIFRAPRPKIDDPPAQPGQTERTGT